MFEMMLKQRMEKGLSLICEKEEVDDKDKESLKFLADLPTSNVFRNFLVWWGRLGDTDRDKVYKSLHKILSMVWKHSIQYDRAKLTRLLFSGCCYEGHEGRGVVDDHLPLIALLVCEFSVGRETVVCVCARVKRNS